MSESLINDSKYGSNWNTWSVKGLNYVSHPAFGVEVGIILVDEKKKAVYEYFGYNVGQPLQEPERFPLHKDFRDLGKCITRGHREIDPLYIEAEISAGGARAVFRAMGGYYDDLIMEIDPVAGDTCIRTAILVKSTENQRNIFVLEEECFVVQHKNKVTGAIKCDFAPEHYSFGLRWESLKDILFRYKSRGSRGEILMIMLPPEQMSSIAVSMAGGLAGSLFRTKKILKTGRKVLESTESGKKRPRLKSESLKGLLEGIRASVFNNFSYDWNNRKPYLPVSKSWVPMIEKILNIEDKTLSGPLVFNWDNAFSAIILAYIHPELSKILIKEMLGYICEDGMLPGLVLCSERADRSNPPIIIMAAWLTYLYTGDKKFIEDIFEALKVCYKFFREKRHGSKLHIFTWGNGRLSGSKLHIPGKNGASYESGWDDSPLWDELGWDENRRTMTADIVDISSYLLVSAKLLRHMARVLGREEDAVYFNAEIKNITSAFENILFSQELGFYQTRKWDGKFAETLTANIFFPMLAGLPQPAMVNRLLSVYHDENHFGGEYMVPVISRSSPEYSGDGDYWRGRVWPPVNYLLYRGFREYDLAHECFELARKSARMFLEEWNGDGHVHENYSSITGRGEPEKGTYARSAPMYTWGGLMGLMMLEEILGVTLDGELVFGTPTIDEEISLEDVEISGRTWSVISGAKRTCLVRDGKKVFVSRPGVRASKFVDTPARRTFRLRGSGRTRIESYDFPTPCDVRVLINGRVRHFSRLVGDAGIIFSEELSSQPTELVFEIMN